MSLNKKFYKNHKTIKKNPFVLWILRRIIFQHKLMTNNPKVPEMREQLGLVDLTKLNK